MTSGDWKGAASEGLAEGPYNIFSALPLGAAKLTTNPAVSRIKHGTPERIQFSKGPLGVSTMSNFKNLFSLQELDSALDLIDIQKTDAEAALNSGAALEPLETALDNETLRLDEFRSLMTDRRLEVESQRERSSHLDTRLYSGEIANPRDLESLEQEATHVREQLQKQDAELLELSIQTEESQNKHSELDKRFTESSAKWEARQAELTELLAKLSTEREVKSSRRVELAATLEPAALRQYENLRRAKGGVAVAKVERGRCQVCRMSLPTRQQQQVRSGRQTVLCSTCGRILLPN